MGCDSDRDVAAERAGTHLNGLRRSVPGLGAVPLADLRAAGTRGLILDLDNTLVPPSRDEVPRETRVFLDEARRLGLRAIILSNGRRARTARLAAHLELPFIAPAKKPAAGGYRHALSALGLTPAQVVAIGDQFLTDGLGAWRQGIPWILTEPLTRREGLLVRVARPVDRILRRLLLPPPDALHR